MIAKTDLRKINQCQRNWQESLDNDIIEYLIDIAINSPTKQNVNFWNLIAITNSETKKELFKFCHSENNKDDNNYNTQVLAPLVFLWTKNIDNTYNRLMTEEYTEKDQLDKHQYLNSGISAGAVTVAAHEIGLQTGFCGCFNSNNIKNWLSESYNIKDNNEPIIILGIGKATANLKNNICINDLGLQYTRDKRSLNRNKTTIIN